MLNDRLRRARSLNNLSLQQVADLSNGCISKQDLSNYEDGQSAPSSTQLIQLAEILNVKPEYFFRSESADLSDIDYWAHSATEKSRQKKAAGENERLREYLERYLAAERLFDASKKPEELELGDACRLKHLVRKALRENLITPSRASELLGEDLGWTDNARTQ